MAATEPQLVVMGMDGGAVASSVYAEQRAEIEAMLATSEQSFTGLLPAGLKHRWIQAVQKPDVAMLDLARTADLFVVGPPERHAPSWE